MKETTMLETTMLETLDKVFSAVSVSGYESGVAEVIKKEVEAYADSVYTDALGNLIAVKKGSSQNPKKIMFAAHMDEIGFMVTFIEDSGYLRIAPIGGINFVAAAFSEVTFASGLKGIIVPESGVESKDYSFEKFYIDIGAKDKKEAEEKVAIGDTLALTPKFTQLLGKRVAGRPMDDKIACVILIDAIKKVGTPKDDLYFVFTVQEEVGCRGSKTAAYAIAPDYALAFDVTSTGDTISAKPMAVKVGGGAAIKLKDNSVICNAELVNMLREIAKEKNIPYQMEVLTFGGTDTSSMQMAREGCRAGCISIPTRYVHSAVELVDMGDCEASVDMLLAFVEKV